MSSVGYNFNDKTQTVETTGAEGKQIITATDTRTVTTAKKQLKTKSGDVIAPVTQKVFKDDVDISTITPVKTSVNTNAKGGMWGTTAGQSDHATMWKDWSSNTSEESYKKNESGVVLNTSSDEYEAARAAKKKRVAKEKEDAAMKNVVEVMKNELPADIQELKDIVAGLLTHLDLEIADGEDASAAQTQQQLDAAILAKKEEIYQYMQAILNINRVGDAIGYVPLTYSVEKFEDAFKNNNSTERRSNKEWADKVFDFVNGFVIANNFGYLSEAGTVDAWDENTSFTDWVDDLTLFIKTLIIKNGYTLPEHREEQKQELLNEINDEKLAAAKTELEDSIRALTTVVTGLQKSMEFNTQYPVFMGIETRIDDYNAVVTKRADHNAPIEKFYTLSSTDIVWDVSDGDSIFNNSTSTMTAIDIFLEPVTMNNAEKYICDLFVENIISVLAANNDIDTNPTLVYNSNVNPVQYFMDITKLIPRVTE